MASELIALRKPYSKTWDMGGGLRRFETVLGTRLHNDDKTPIDCAMRTSAGVWTVGTNSWDYALGKPDDKAEDGWTAFGVGKDRIRFRLLGMGYLHWPTRDWQPIVGAPIYDRAKFKSIDRPLILGPQGAEAELYPVGMTEWTGLWNIAGDNVWMRQRVEGRKLKEEVGLSQRARAWIGTNARPVTPANETFFGLLYELDPHEVYRWYQAGHTLDIDAGFDDLAGTIELRTGANGLLARMPQSTAHIETADLRIPAAVGLRKRIWRDPASGRFYLALGARVDELARLPAGDLVFDPTLTTQPDAAAGKDTRLLVHATGQAYNYGVSVHCSVGRFDTDANRQRFLIYWDVSSIPGGSTITSAIETYYCSDSTYSYVDTLVDAYHIAVANADWPEGTKNGTAGGAGDSCWLYKDQDSGSETAWAGSAGLSTAGTDYIDAVRGTLTVPNPLVLDQAMPRTLDNALVLGWLTTNNGLFNRARTELGSDQGFHAHSSDGATAATRPKLVVEYTVAGNPWYYYAQQT